MSFCVIFLFSLFSLANLLSLLFKNISCSNPVFEEEDQRILLILNADLRVFLLVVILVVAVAADS